MQTTTNETISQQSGPTLQLKRSLLTIGEYAASQGLSIGIVNECSKLGIVQIRKHKGKTFVVDVPLAPYLYTPETTGRAAQPVDKAAQTRRISDLVRKIIPDTPDKHPAETINEQIQTPDLEILEIDDEFLELIDEAAETEEEPELTLTSRDNEVQFALLTSQARSRRAWQVAGFFLMVSLFMVLLGSFWLYMDRKIQLNGLERAYASIQEIHKNSRQADQRAEALRNKLAGSRVELEHVRNELDNSGVQLKTTQKELTAVRQKLKNIRYLTNWLPELTENP